MASPFWHRSFTYFAVCSTTAFSWFRLNWGTSNLCRIIHGFGAIWCKRPNIFLRFISSAFKKISLQMSIRVFTGVFVEFRWAKQYAGEDKVFGWRFVMNSPRICFTSPEAIRHILVKHCSNYVKTLESDIVLNSTLGPVRCHTLSGCTRPRSQLRSFVSLARRDC